MDPLYTDGCVDYLNRINRNPGPSGGNVDVTLTVKTLTGLVDHPGNLPGFGPVIADVARKIANDPDAKLRVVMCDDVTGEPTYVVTPSRKPLLAQRRRTEARNRTYVLAGCRMPASGCDINHTIAVTDGGETCDCNLAPLCRHDHCIKHQHDWTCQRLPDGTPQWTTRLGHTYTTNQTSETRQQKPDT